MRLDSQKLIYLRGYLNYLVSEDEYRNLCISARGESEVQEWISCVNSESISKKRFELRNTENKKRICEIEKNTPKISDLDETRIRSINKLFDGYL